MATPVCVCVCWSGNIPLLYSDVVGIQDKKKRTKPKERNTQNSMCVTENVVYCKLFYFSLYECYSVSSCLSPCQ